VTDLAPILQGFFTDRLARQKKASPNTVAAYRDTCRLLLAFAQAKTGKAPSRLSLADLDATLVGAFLQHLEDDRGNGSATRNARLAAIHSLFKYAAPRAPEHAAVISQVLAVPPRRRERAIVGYLTPEEADALIAAPDRRTWHGRRDHALLLLAVQTGLRVSELTGLARQDVHLGAGPHVRCHGKGRKDRATPLTSQTVAVLRTWLAGLSASPDSPLFPGRTGGRLSRDAVEMLVAKHAATAEAACPSIKEKNVTPHTLRHYVDGRVMWPAAASPLVAEPRGLVPATERSEESPCLFTTIRKADSHGDSKRPRGISSGDRRVERGRQIAYYDQAPRGGAERVRQVPAGPRPGPPDRGGLDHPGNLGGSDTWEDAEPWWHRRGTRMSCVIAR
jgi:integrase/recombinase XerD